MSNASANHQYTKEWLKSLLSKAQDRVTVPGQSDPGQTGDWWDGYQRALSDVVEAWGEYEG